MRGGAFAALAAVDNLHSFAAASLFCILIVRTSPLGRGEGHKGQSFVGTRLRLDSSTDPMIFGVQCLSRSGVLNRLVFLVRANVDVAHKDNGLDESNEGKDLEPFPNGGWIIEQIRHGLGGRG